MPPANLQHVQAIHLLSFRRCQSSWSVLETPTGLDNRFYTILVAGDDMNEPVADEVRSILDGHIILSSELAQKYHFPAIDVLSSASRVLKSIATKNMLP